MGQITSNNKIKEAISTQTTHVEMFMKQTNFMEKNLTKFYERVEKLEETTNILSKNIENVIFDVNSFIRVHADTVSAISQRLERIEKSLNLFMIHRETETLNTQKRLDRIEKKINNK